MPRFIIYLFPAMMDMVVGSFLFVGTVRLAEEGFSATAVTGVVACWAFTYMVACLLMGRLVSTRNAAPLIVIAGVGAALNALLAILIVHPYALYPLIAMQALTAACFFAPFQIFMKAVEHGNRHGVVRATANYTFAWSLGIACGPFINGFVWEAYSWQYCHVINLVLGLVTAGGILFLRHYAQETPEPAVSARTVAASAKAGTAGAEQDSQKRDFAWLGWIVAGVGCFAMYLITSVFPKTAQNFEISKDIQGVIIALIHGGRAFTSLAFRSGKQWMYRPAPLVFFGVLGIIGLIAFTFGQSPLTFALAALSFGAFSAAFFFYLVYHSLVHPERSARYVSINEAVVGVTAFLGPVVGGLVADHISLAAPYTVAAVIVLLVVALQAAVHARALNRRAAPLPAPAPGG